MAGAEKCLLLNNDVEDPAAGDPEAAPAAVFIGGGGRGGGGSGAWVIHMLKLELCQCLGRPSGHLWPLKALLMRQKRSRNDDLIQDARLLWFFPLLRRC